MRKRVGFQHLLGRTLEYHLTTFASGLRTDIDDIVGRQHHILVVLHHDDRITQVAQFLQRTDQALVVPLVQTNRRFVEDIQHVDQLRTNLRGQSDALALTARQRGRLTVQRQIIQSHVQKEIQSGAYLLQYLCGNLLLLFVQVLLGFIQPFAQFSARNWSDHF